MPLLWGEKTSPPPYLRMGKGCAHPSIDWMIKNEAGKTALEVAEESGLQAIRDSLDDAIKLCEWLEKLNLPQYR